MSLLGGRLGPWPRTTSQSPRAVDWGRLPLAWGAHSIPLPCPLSAGTLSQDSAAPSSTGVNWLLGTRGQRALARGAWAPCPALPGRGGEGQFC